MRAPRRDVNSFAPARASRAPATPEIIKVYGAGRKKLLIIRASKNPVKPVKIQSDISDKDKQRMVLPS